MPSRLGLFLAAALACVPARADVLFGPRTPVLAWGGLEAHPYLRLSETYHSNIFLSPPGSEVSSWIHTANPGLKASLEGLRNRLDLYYDAELQFFTKDPSLNNAVNQGAGILYKYAGPEVKVVLRDDFLNTVDPPNSEQTGRQRRWQNAAGADAEYAPEGGALFFGVEGSHTAHKYVADNPALRSRLNRYEQRAGARLGYRIMPKTRAYGGYRRGVIHYTADVLPPTKNNKSHTLFAGLEADLANKLDARVEAGLDRRKYDDEPVSGGGRTARNFLFDARLGYEPIERTRLELSASRSLQEALLAANRFYTATGASAALTHRFPERLAVSLRASYERDVYSDSARRDDVYLGRAGLGYKLLDWLRLEAAYQRRARRSRGFSDRFDYRADVYSLGAVLSL